MTKIQWKKQLTKHHFYKIYNAVFKVFCFLLVACVCCYLSDLTWLVTALFSAPLSPLSWQGLIIAWVLVQSSIYHCLQGGGSALDPHHVVIPNQTKEKSS